jgi:hypothetical protein
VEGKMTFTEWIDQKAEMKIRFTEYEKYYLREAWELGRAEAEGKKNKFLHGDPNETDPKADLGGRGE